MSQSDSDTSKQLCDICNRPTEITFSRVVTTPGSVDRICNLCPSCISSHGNVSKELADYSPEA